MNKYILLFFFLLFYVPSIAQFSDSTHYYIGLNASGNVNQTKDGDSYLLNNGFKFSVKKKKVQLNFNNSWLYGKQNKDLTNNDYAGGLDFNLYREKKLYYWGLANYTTSHSLKILDQFQGGLGIAYPFINTEKNQLNISNGILYEMSRLYLNDTTLENYHTFRNSFRVIFKYSISSSIVFEGTGFLQNSLNYKDDYIIRANSSLSFKLRKWIAFTTSLNYNRHERTKRENILMSYGVRLEQFF